VIVGGSEGAVGGIFVTVGGSDVVAADSRVAVGRKIVAVGTAGGVEMQPANNRLRLKTAVIVSQRIMFFAF
jgi:hypothetical protein